MPTRQELRRLSGWTVAIPILVAVGLFSIVMTARPRMWVCSVSKNDIAVLMVKKFETEAFPMWAASHPGQTCPHSIDELDDRADSKDGRDPWGERYLMWCTPERIEVWSSGEDRINGTADDIRSTDP